MNVMAKMTLLKLNYNCYLPSCLWVTILQIIKLVFLSLDTLVPNSRDWQGKLWLLKKQKTPCKTTLK